MPLTPPENDDTQKSLWHDHIKNKKAMTVYQRIQSGSLTIQGMFFLHPPMCGSMKNNKPNPIMHYLRAAGTDSLRNIEYPILQDKHFL